MAARQTTNRQQRLQRVEQAWTLRMKGYTLHAIADKVGTSHVQVLYDLNVAKKQAIERIKTSHEEFVAEKVSQYENIRRTAWEAYDKSIANLERETEEFALQTDEATMVASEVRIKRISMREGRLPANTYLATIMATLQAERELLGLDAPKKTEHSGAVTVNVFDWAALTERTPEPDILEQRIKMLDNLPIEGSSDGSQREPVGQQGVPEMQEDVL